MKNENVSTFTQRAIPIQRNSFSKKESTHFLSSWQKLAFSKNVLHLLRSKLGVGGGIKIELPTSRKADTVKEKQTLFVHEVCAPRKQMPHSLIFEVTRIQLDPLQRKKKKRKQPGSAPRPQLSAEGKKKDITNFF